MGKRYSKSIGAIFELKSDFLSQNDQLLAANHEIAEILKSQPKRTACKICLGPVPERVFIASHGLNYYLCENCGHLNSEHEDTLSFAKHIYADKSYSDGYKAENEAAYNKRLTNIYLPKAQFLYEYFVSNGIKVEKQKVIDIGAGSGYFIGALKSLNFDTEGIEVSEQQVSFANAMLGSGAVKLVDQIAMAEEVELADASVLSAIGVLEHIIELDDIIESIRRNKNIEYVFLSVPLLSFSVFVEACNEDVFNRHLGGAHSHLFTDKSLAYLADRLGFIQMESWKFGADIMDLFRSVSANLSKEGLIQARDYFLGQYVPIMDELQSVFDHGEFSSEVHVILKRK